MPLVKVKKNYQITIPTNLRKTLKIAEGDYLEVEKQNRELILRPMKMVRPDEAYFYSKEWQEGEKKADENIKNGEVLGPFTKVKEGLKALKTAKI
jgi:antitoxin MazE